MFGYANKLDKVMYGLILFGLFVIGLGGGYLRLVQQRIIDTQQQRAEQIAEIIKTQQQRAEQIKNLDDSIKSLSVANDEFRRHDIGFQALETLQIEKLDTIIKLLTSGNTHMKHMTLTTEEMKKTEKQVEQEIHDANVKIEEGLKHVKSNVKPQPTPTPIYTPMPTQRGWKLDNRGREN